MHWDEERFRANFSTLLDERGLSQRELANRMAIDETTVGKWTKPKIKGGTIPPLPIVCVIAEQLGVRPACIAFYDKHEPLDDEELSLMEDWRKFTTTERRSFARMLRHMSLGRERLKTQPIARKRAKPSAAAAQSTSAPSLREALLTVQAELAEIQSRTIPSADQEFALAQNANALLDRLFDPRYRPKAKAAPAKPADAAAPNASAGVMTASRRTDLKP